MDRITPTAAIAARRRQTQNKLADVERAVAQLRRERGRVKVTAIARRAGVSSTFLYENAQARALVHEAVSVSRDVHSRRISDEHDRIEATWRERALNAEDGLTQAHNEIRMQRTRIGELLGQLRAGTSDEHGRQTSPAADAEITALKRQNRQLTQEHRGVQERLEGCRANLRAADERVAELEAQLAEAVLAGHTKRRDAGSARPHE
ncbi:MULTISPECIES: DUF6262 family protein [unclassified Streptomyces]|uniref:DUF6262 family protein n=1 Tax=unclassified Streptomyces TaxID=2593676 RepID=UPI002E188974|nr:MULTISPECIES: DUF6262 family protein [unclassified Streptomyces]